MTEKKIVWTPSLMGKKGGAISKRVLTPEQARAMVAAKMAKKQAKQLENNEYSK